MSADTLVDVWWFDKRINELLSSWESTTSEPDAKKMQSVGGILLAAGSAKTGALQIFLLERKLASSLIFITPNAITFLCNEAQAEFLAPLARPQVKVISKSEDKAEGNSAMEELLLTIEQVTQKGQKIGVLDKDKYTGKFLYEWILFLEDKDKMDILDEAEDVSSGVSILLASKVPQEIYHIGVACHMAHKLLSVLCHQMMELIEIKKKTTHEELAELMEGKLEAASMCEGAQFPLDFRDDACIRSVNIQSGGKYDLRISAKPNPDTINNTGIILASTRIRYKFYPSHVSRTIMIDPHPTQIDNYQYLLELQNYALKTLKEGLIAKEFYDLVKAKAAADHPELESRLPKSLGSGLGVEFCDPFLSLSPKCTRILQKNMVFSLTLSFADLEDPFDNSKTYSLQLTDTVLVGKEGSRLLYDGLKELSHVVFHVNNKPSQTSTDPFQEEESDTKPGKSKRASPPAIENNTTAKRKIHLEEPTERRQDVTQAVDNNCGGVIAKVEESDRVESSQEERDLPSASTTFRVPSFKEEGQAREPTESELERCRLDDESELVDGAVTMSNTVVPTGSFINDNAHYRLSIRKEELENELLEIKVSRARSDMFARAKMIQDFMKAGASAQEAKELTESLFREYI